MCCPNLYAKRQHAHVYIYIERVCFVHKHQYAQHTGNSACLCPSFSVSACFFLCVCLSVCLPLCMPASSHTCLPACLCLSVYLRCLAGPRSSTAGSRASPLFTTTPSVLPLPTTSLAKVLSEYTIYVTRSTISHYLKTPRPFQ